MFGRSISPFAEPGDDPALAAAVARDGAREEADQDDGGEDAGDELHLPGWLILSACAIGCSAWFGIATLAAWAWRHLPAIDPLKLVGFVLAGLLIWSCVNALAGLARRKRARRWEY